MSKFSGAFIGREFATFALAMFFFSFINLRPKVGVSHAFAWRLTTTGQARGMSGKEVSQWLT